MSTAYKMIAGLATGVLVSGATYLTADFFSVHAAPLGESTSLPDVATFAQASAGGERS